MTTNASAPDAVRAIEEDSAAVESVVRPALGSAGGTLSGPLLLQATYTFTIVFAKGLRRIQINSSWQTVAHGVYLLAVVLIQTGGGRRKTMTASSETSATAPPMVRWDDDVAEDVLWKRIVRLLDKRERVLIGIVGPPGAGKSTIAQAVVNTVEQHLPEQVALVPMDGYHLAESAIERLGLDDSKGGPDTFDVFGYVALLERLRHADGEIVYAPKFRPDIDDSVPAAIPVNPDVRVVVTEGNYLLLDTPPWSMVRPLLDESWYIQVDEATRRERLIVRHIRFKADGATARTRALGPDQRNAELVEAARNRADLIIDYL